jgi:uncharacterized protein (DUF1330 family)
MKERIPMSPVTNNPDQFQALAHNPNPAPFVMLNLLKFRPAGGGRLYARYMREAARFVEGVGGKIVYLGAPRELLSGEQTWDILMLVEYPSRRAFIEMANNPEYLKIHAYREQALERAVLYATDPTTARALAGQ